MVYAMSNSNQIPLIQINDLEKTFLHRGKNLTVLEGLDLKIFAGDTVSIMGPSGAGKSTLLQIMGTLDSPTKGTMLFDGIDVFKLSESQLAKFRNKNVGFAFQFHHLLPDFSALENVMMPGLVGRLNRSQVEEDAIALLTEVGLKERLNHKPGELSGGEQQRVAIARALFMKPKILLADEPTGNLDRKTGAEIHALLKRMNSERGVTIVVVTHDPELADSMSVRLIVKDGSLVPKQAEDGNLEGRLPLIGADSQREFAS